MKRIIAVIVFFSLFALLANTAQAQSDDNRNKLEMTIVYGGKTIVTGVNSLSTSITRYASDAEAGTPKDTAKKAKDAYNGFYLSMVVKKVDTDLLRLFSKRDTRFDGTITVTDTYGKNAPTIIKFSGASLQTYTDQFSGVTYNDSYSGANVVLSCQVVSMNGIEIEQLGLGFDSKVSSL